MSWLSDRLVELFMYGIMYICRILMRVLFIKGRVDIFRFLILLELGVGFLSLYLLYGIFLVFIVYWFLVEAGLEIVCDEVDMLVDFWCFCMGVCWNNLINNSFD